MIILKKITKVAIYKYLYHKIYLGWQAVVIVQNRSWHTVIKHWIKYVEQHYNSDFFNDELWTTPTLGTTVE